MMVNSVDKFLREWGRWWFFCGHFVTCARCFQHHNLNNSLKLLKCFRQYTAVSTVAHTTCVHVFHCICHGHHQSFFVYLFCSFTSGVCSIWHLDRNLVGLYVWYAAFLFDIPGYWCWFNQDNVHIYIHIVLCFDLVQSRRRRKKDLPTLVLSF